MLILKLIQLAIGFSRIAELTATPNNVTFNLNLIEKINQFMNYSTFINTSFHDLEDDYEYYRCGFKGIKAFRQNFVTSKSETSCRLIENIEFNHDKCGIGNSDLTKAPWLVSVMIQNFSGNGAVLYRATGSIVHPKLILMPHEPFEPFSTKKIMIRSNGQSQSLVIDNMSIQTREVAQVITETFMSTKYQNLKKSMLLLAEPILFNDHAQSVCLPVSDDQYKTENCYVLGWNRSNRLLKLKTKLIECNNLNQLYGKLVPRGFFVCTNRNIVEPFIQDANYCRENQICDFSTVLMCPAIGHADVFYQVGVGHMVANNLGYFLSTIASKLWIDKTFYNLQFKKLYHTRNSNESSSHNLEKR